MRTGDKYAQSSASTATPDTRGAVVNANGDEATRDHDLAYLQAQTRPADHSEGDAIPIVDLFAGLGGLTLGAVEGARRSGRRAELTLAVDREDEALDVLGRTLGADDKCHTTDLEEVLQPIAKPESAAEKDLFGAVAAGSLLLAGPPCQGHSNLNNHTRHDDPRNDLYLAVARVARLVEPRAIIIENVKSILNDRRNSVARCAAALEELGYEVEAESRALHDIGVPQRRHRHVLVATANTKFEWNLPDCSGRTVRWAIEDLVDVDDPGDRDTAPKASADNQRRIDYLFDKATHNLPNPERPVCHQEDGHTYLSMYGRLKWDEPAQTITTGFTSMGQGRYVHPSQRRTLTHREAARLQFLPDFIDFGELRGRRGAVATMIGNAAPPKLSMAVVEALIEQGLL